MNKALINRSIKVTLIFMIIFFLLNYFTMKQPDIMSVVGRTLATVAFFILYLVAFTILSSPERK